MMISRERQRRIKATLLGDAEPKFAWYDGDMELDTVFSASKDINGKPITKKHFKYDTGKGDQNHILWFSPEVTEEDLTEQIKKNKDQGYDGVSITGMPKEDKSKTYQVIHDKKLGHPQ
ncbi:hypothetical protein L3081_20050 [Colwellia sp. MSW7]|uniref:Uncharacterized protein n=1 Tax=Colwellia maritima TaxID=2912588 RepID=A0ABS9X707_9GAMM|nr:hypothetical protein [Colwellia maritima]MCI2285251.1 hypothetical protein [Colwellia maritima]